MFLGGLRKFSLFVSVCWVLFEKVGSHVWGGRGEGVAMLPGGNYSTVTVLQ